MKLLILSDSHGNVDNMVLAVIKEKPDMILHLGDCMADARQLHKRFPEIPMEGVPGTCDCSMDMPERTLLVEGFRILMLHGHSRNVKAGYLNLEMAAREKEVDLALFGHTHRGFCEYHNGTRFLNPGSIGSPGYGAKPSYGLVFLEEGSGKIETSIVNID